MTTTTIQSVRSSARYSAFPVNRVKRVRLRARELVDGALGAFDFSASKWEIHLRFWPWPLTRPATADRDYTMTKILTTALTGDGGVCEVNAILPTVRELVLVEWVAVETDVSDGTTPSGKKEHLLGLPWFATAFETASTV